MLHLVNRCFINFQVYQKWWYGSDMNDLWIYKDILYTHMSRSMDSSLLTSVLQLMYGLSFSMTLHTRVTNMSIFLCQTFQVTMWMLASLQWALRGGDFQLFYAYVFTVGELPSLKRSQRVQTPESQWLENYIFRELLGLGREYLVTFCRQNSSICLGKKLPRFQ